jgi:hypothetical protein
MVTPVLKADVRPQRKAWAVDPIGEGTLTDADFGGCRWIEGDPSPLRRGMFCGLPVVPGESWCARHRSVVFGALAADLPADGWAGGSAAGWHSRRSAAAGLSPSRHGH